MLKNLLGILLVLQCTLALGQSHEWAFDIKNASGYSTINAQAVDDSSNVYIAGVFRGIMYLGSDTFSFATGTTNDAIFIAKYDKDGNYIWGKAVTSAQSASVADMVINSKNQILLFGKYRIIGSGSVSFDSISLSRSDAVFLAFMNTSGTFTNALDLGYTIFTTALAISLGTNDEIHVAMNLRGFSGSWYIVNGSSTTSGTGSVQAVAKFNADATSLSWSRVYSSSGINNIYDIDVDRHNQVYFTCLAGKNRTVFGYSTPAINTTNFIIWLRPNGDFKEKVVSISAISATGARLGNEININQIKAIDSTKIYISGNSYYDSLAINNSKIYRPVMLGNNRFFKWIAELSNFDTLSWYRATSDATSNIPGNLTIRGDFLYFSILQNFSGFSFGGFTTTSNVGSVVSKLDRLGNVLWYIPIRSSVPPIVSGIGSQDMVYSGGFTSTLTLSPFSLSNRNTPPKPFLAKTFDLSITRGKVSEGPYCAGDTFLIPYTKSGEFDTSNFFIAEISDDNGVFFGGQRELGRIKTIRDSTVAGILPLFQVASSNKYRIRIRSTSPTVQSYYQLDTLNLLIYSRDKADPGPDTSVCFGDTLQLNTFGGTAWSWSPAYAMNDSTLRNPLIAPTIDTIYQIIISDSSGCGAPDTAVVSVKIRPSPTFVSSSQSDTLVCRKNDVTLRNSFEGGTGTYYVTWYQIWNQNQAKLLTILTTETADSLLVAPRVSTNYMAILTDSCSILLDTVFYRVEVYERMKIVEKSSDSLLCIGASIDLGVSVMHPLMDSIFFVWKTSSSPDTISRDSTFEYRSSQSETVRVTVNNTCNDENRTFSYRLTTRTELVNEITILNAKNVWCQGEILEARAVGQGGVDTSYIFTWQINDMRDSGSAFSIRIDSLYLRFPSQDSFTLRAFLADGCTSLGDTAIFGFRVLKPIQIDSISNLESTVCLGASKILRVHAQGGDTNEYSYSWRVNGSEVGTNRAYTFDAADYMSGSSVSLLVIVSDGCSVSDTLEAEIVLPEVLNTIISMSDTIVCQGSSLLFTSISSGGYSDDYIHIWSIDDVESSASDSFSYTFTNSSATRDSTYLVIRSLSDGCNSPFAADSVVITVRPNPTVSFTLDSTTTQQRGDTLLCRGENLKIDFTSFYALGFSPRLYEGTTLLSSVSPYTFIGNQDTELLLISPDGCGTSMDSATFTIRFRDSLVLEPMADATLCMNESLNFTAIARGGKSIDYKYTWTNTTDGSTLSNSAELNLPEVNTTLSISVKVTDGCTTPADSQRIEIAVLEPLSISLESDELCAAEITAVARPEGGIASDYSLSWKLDGVLIFGNADNSIQVNPTTLSYLIVTLTDGCSSPADADSIQILPDLQFGLVDHQDSVCEEFETRWQVESSQNLDYEYQWREQSQTAYSPLASTQLLPQGVYQYYIKATNELGCEDSITADLVVKERPLAGFSWTPGEADFDNQIVTFTADNEQADVYRWSSSMTPFFGTNSVFTYEYDAVGEYPITLRIDRDGCIDSLTQILTFKDAFRYFDVSAFSPNGDGLNDTYKPYTKGVKELDYTIYNRWGEKIYEGDLLSKPWDGTYQGSAVPNGTYLVSIAMRQSDNKRVFDNTVIHVIR